MTLPETKVWHAINRKQLGARFRRQFSIGPYIVDFCRPRQKLVIEIDGDTHFGDGAESYDQKRTEYLNEQNFTVIRFTNIDVMQNLSGITEAIKRKPDPL